MLTRNASAQPEMKNRIDSLKAALNSAGSDTTKLNILESLYLITNCNDPASTKEYLNEYLKIAKKAKKRKNAEQAERWLGLFYSQCEQDYANSISWFINAAADAKGLGDRKEEALIYSLMANAFENDLDNASALEYYHKSMETDPGKEKEILGNMGNLYSNVGDYPKAAEYFEKAYRIQDAELRTGTHNSANDTLNLIGLLINLAEVDIYMSQYGKALNSYKLSMEFNRSIRNQFIDLLVLMGIGNCFQLQMNYDEAIKYYELALPIGRELNVGNNESEILIKLGNIYLAKSEPDKAMAYARLALAAAAGKQNPTLPGTYLLLGRIHTSKQDHIKAVDFLQKAIELYNKAGKVDDESTAWKALSTAYEQMHKTTEAFNAYKHYITLRDSVFSLDKARQITSTELRGEFGRKQISDSLAQARKDTAVRLHIQRQRGLIIGGFAGLGMVLLLAFFIYRNYKQQKKAYKTITNTHKALVAEKHVSETLLLNILPADVADELKANGKVQAKRFDNVSVLMTDFVGFTMAGMRLSPEELVAELHACFEVFDNIIGRHKIEKIKTIGDAYMAVSGLPIPDTHHAENLVRAAIEINAFMQDRVATLGDRTFSVRIGIHTGSVVAGIVGVKKFAYDIWGDTVNTAARMEQHGQAGKINISGTTYELIKDKFTCEYRGEIEAKNKGKMKMYFVG